MKCFYHNDLDGQCAGAIVYKFYKLDRDFTEAFGEPCDFIPIDYKDDFPMERIEPNETIVIVDFSLQKEGQFEELLGITDKVIWVDHHKTAIERHGDLDVKGIRQDGKAGCVLTWEYFYPNSPLPDIVELIGDYDVWDFRRGDETRNLQAGIQLYGTSPRHNNWGKWFDDFNTVLKVIETGKTVLNYRKEYYKDIITAAAFFIDFEGHKAIACNAVRVNSMLFDSVEEDFDLMIPFYFNGKNWTVSLYTTKDIDCSEIAKKYKGGGHKQAAGFQCDKLPFIS